jgi:hypothetical protein
LAKVTTPPDALTVVVPPTVPADPEVCTATVTDAVDPVTKFPAESRTDKTGCVASAAPETPATGCVVMANCVAAPGPLGVTLPELTVKAIAGGPEENCRT